VQKWVGVFAYFARTSSAFILIQLYEKLKYKPGWPNPVRQSAAVGLLIENEKLRPTHTGKNPVPGSRG